MANLSYLAFIEHLDPEQSILFWRGDYYTSMKARGSLNLWQTWWIVGGLKDNEFIKVTSADHA